MPPRQGLSGSQVKGAAHSLIDVPAQSAEMTHHGTLGLRLAFLNPLARLEGGGLKLLQFLLRRVVGRLDGLRLGCQHLESRPQA
jgi:hypothetical protein